MSVPAPEHAAQTSSFTIPGWPSKSTAVDVDSFFDFFFLGDKRTLLCSLLLLSAAERGISASPLLLLTDFSVFFSRFNLCGRGLAAGAETLVRRDACLQSNKENHALARYFCFVVVETDRDAED